MFFPRISKSSVQSTPDFLSAANRATARRDHTSASPTTSMSGKVSHLGFIDSLTDPEGQRLPTNAEMVFHYDSVTRNEHIACKQSV
jgi:hypothetical protein